MIILKDDGETLLAADEEGNLYDGTRVQVGWDELVVETTEVEDGYERITRWGDEVMSKGNLTREGWEIAYVNGHPDADQEELDAAWVVELGLTHHGKILVNAYVDGEEVTMEKKLTKIDWVAR